METRQLGHRGPHVGVLASTDFRRHNPRYAGENLATNTDRFAPLIELVRAQGITPAQLALAWLLHQGSDVFAIPGTRRPERIEENAKAADIELSAELLRRIDVIARPGLAEGASLV
jgi:aryl-alcohol dehydrogenase-like predicted oxidoreductase